MKHLLALFTICLIGHQLAKSQNRKPDTFFIDGHLIGRDTGIVILQYNDKDQTWIADTARVNKGRFSFTGAIHGPTYATFIGYTKSRSVDDPNFTTIFLEPNAMTVTVEEDDFKQATVLGSHTQELAAELYLLQEPVREALRPVSEALSIAWKAAQGDKASQKERNRVDSLALRANALKEQLKAIRLAFVRQHPNEFISSYELFIASGSIPQDSLRFYYETLSAEVRDNSYGQMIYRELMPKKEPTAIVGSTAPSINMEDMDGNALTLESLKGKKHVLLDFWASWCGPCREMNPNLRNIYSCYKNKGLEIISLSFDFDENSWKKAISDDDINDWRHVLVGLNSKVSASVRNDFDVSTVPSYVLLDKEGVIVGRYETISKEKDGLIEALQGLFEDQQNGYHPQNPIVK